MSLSFLLERGATGNLIPTRKGGMPGRWIVKEKVGNGYIWSKNFFIGGGHENKNFI
jgi:hypothetical protein